MLPCSNTSMGQCCDKTPQKYASTDSTQRDKIKDFDAEGKEDSNQSSNKSASQHSHSETGMFLIPILYIICL